MELVRKYERRPYCNTILTARETFIIILWRSLSHNNIIMSVSRIVTITLPGFHCNSNVTNDACAIIATEHILTKAHPNYNGDTQVSKSNPVRLPLFMCVSASVLGQSPTCRCLSCVDRAPEACPALVLRDRTRITPNVSRTVAVVDLANCTLCVALILSWSVTYPLWKRFPNHGTFSYRMFSNYGVLVVSSRQCHLEFSFSTNLYT